MLNVFPLTKTEHGDSSQRRVLGWPRNVCPWVPLSPLVPSGMETQQCTGQKMGFLVLLNSVTSLTLLVLFQRGLSPQTGNKLCPMLASSSWTLPNFCRVPLGLCWPLALNNRVCCDLSWVQRVSLQNPSPGSLGPGEPPRLWGTRSCSEHPSLPGPRAWGCPGHRGWWVFHSWWPVLGCAGHQQVRGCGWDPVPGVTRGWLWEPCPGTHLGAAPAPLSACFAHLHNYFYLLFANPVNRMGKD